MRGLYPADVLKGDLFNSASARTEEEEGMMYIERKQHNKAIEMAIGRLISRSPFLAQGIGERDFCLHSPVAVINRSQR